MLPEPEKSRMSVESSVPRLSVIGLGKLGSPMAAVFAARGFQVIGLDRDRACVDALNAGRSPVEEPQLQEHIDLGRDRLRATTSIDEAIAGSDVSFVIVPTPSGPDHVFSNAFVLDAVTHMGRAIGRKRGDHLVVITSTVMPGSTGGEIRHALEHSSGRVVGRTVGLCYSPEFIALGSVVHDLLHPDMVLIGECDERYGAQLEAVYALVTESAPAVHRMNFVNAEICKIAVNTFVTTKISYANMLSDFCDHLEGADVDTISRALGADSRIGAKYLKGGVAYGGPCFPRDNKAFAALGRALGVKCDLADATDRINDYQVQRLLGAEQAVGADGALVAVLGLSYKLHTPVLEQSQGMALARALMDEGYRVIVADPLSGRQGAAELGPAVQVAPGFAAAIAAADLVVITTPWPEIRSVSREAFLRPSGTLPIIDPWGLLKGTAIADVTRLILPGRGGWRSMMGRARPLAHSGTAG
jgi:UDPglucose 6-dehydrogenase